MEKRLRSLLSHCAEWNDAAERTRLAAALEAEEAASGDVSGAVEVLRSHSSAHMRKHAMLRLCHAWRYRSDCWSERSGTSGAGGGTTRKRQRRAASSDEEDAVPPAPQAAALQSDRTLVTWQLVTWRRRRCTAFWRLTSPPRRARGPAPRAPCSTARRAGRA